MAEDDFDGELLAIQLDARRLFLARLERALAALDHDLLTSLPGTTLRRLIVHAQVTMSATDPAFVLLARQLDRNPDALESVEVGLAIALIAVREWPMDELNAAVDEIVLATIDATT